MNIFLARQPIFDHNLQVIAYELLFRDGVDNLFTAKDKHQATSYIMADSLLHFEVDKLTDGKKAFINTTLEVLVDECVLLLPSQYYSVEVTESVPADPQVLAACRRLREHGYAVILDDFDFSPDRLPLLEVADMVKIDILHTPKERQRHYLQHYGGRGFTFLAEKVETQEDFAYARDFGYTFFQGYFFSKPMIVAKQDVPGIKFYYLRMLQEINRPDLDLGQLDDIIRRDVSLTFKLLKYINSPFFGLQSVVTSIQHAMVVLGEKELRKWACLIAMGRLGEDKPAELVMNTLIRARFCESLARLAGMPTRAQDLFLMGIFSNVHVIVGRPLEEILEAIPIAEEVKAALFGRHNRFREILELVLAYEKGNWPLLTELVILNHLPEEQIPVLYLQAVEWAGQSIRS